MAANRQPRGTRPRVHPLFHPIPSQEIPPGGTAIVGHAIFDAPEDPDWPLGKRLFSPPCVFFNNARRWPIRSGCCYFCALRSRILFSVFGRPGHHENIFSRSSPGVDESKLQTPKRQRNTLNWRFPKIFRLTTKVPPGSIDFFFGQQKTAP